MVAEADEVDEAAEALGPGKSESSRFKIQLYFDVLKKK